MSKLNMRARKLNAQKPLPIHRAETISLYDPSLYGRNALTVATGVEKEEETEHHLQAVILAAQSETKSAADVYIPIPDASKLAPNYDEFYKGGFHRATKLIGVNSDNYDAVYESYDMDEEDTAWLETYNSEARNSARKLTEDLFEQLIGYFESRSKDFETMEPTLDDFVKASAANATDTPSSTMSRLPSPMVLATNAAKACYNYWFQRREKTGRPLNPMLKPESVPNSESDSYVCFRRRELRSIRKSRRNDQQSLHKLQKLHEDFDKLHQIMELVVKRDRLKREALLLDLLVFDKKLKIWDLKAKLRAAGVTEREHSADGLLKNHKRFMQGGNTKLRLNLGQKSIGEIIHSSTGSMLDGNNADFMDARLIPEKLLGTDPYESPEPIVDPPVDALGYAPHDYEDFTDVIEFDSPNARSLREQCGFFDAVTADVNLRKSPRIQPSYRGIRCRRGRGGRIIVDRSTTAMLFRQRPSSLSSSATTATTRAAMASTSTTTTSSTTAAATDDPSMAQLQKRLRYEPAVIDEELLPWNDENTALDSLPAPPLYANGFLSVRLPFFTPQDLKEMSIKNPQMEYFKARRQKSQQLKLQQKTSPNGIPRSLAEPVIRSTSGSSH